MRSLSAFPRYGDGWLEAILLPVLALLLVWILNPSDPLLLRADFPWLLLIPLLIALRYEFLPALLATLILGSTFLWHPYPLAPSLVASAGTVVVALVGAEFASYWRRREAGRALQEEITATRLRQLADDLYVTRVSLDRLEQSLLYQPVSVRTAVHELRSALAAQHGHLDAAVLQRVLYFLNQLAGVQVAAWYRVGAEEAHPQRLAQLGAVADWDGADPVWREALAKGQSQNIAALELTQIHHYLSVHVHGDEQSERQILAVEDMSFFAINRESLQIVEVLFQYLCNYADSLQFAKPILQRWPDCPAAFATDFLQLQRLAAVVPEVGFCICYDFHPGADADLVVGRIATLRRGLDVLWLHRDAKHSCLLVLLPFAGPAAADGYRLRIENELRDGFLAQWQQAFRSCQLFRVDGSAATTQLASFLDSGTKQ
ncbi:hypothetical protein HFQ13_08295 [Acidithiobacillus sp. VAN18-1]|uniref:PelD GGDEF domain-containing protein n=1 Tax=Igneacidithiobacillus copahuensis TaxID=2724909 RepID=A0AAE2YQJ8_9PROT|nr:MULTISPECIES: PelD GGDEF domain-containing protein [Acidithiobacillaceae]MBU2788203.1 hypothetical protein [Igneacidithiobacillus copahuensis]MBU2795474.1 hypothetical protein [Acidithiobacillus sp. VAN18-2]MBU2842589.1 hypothetical protein [Acidithiobacillus thiooxidans]